MRFGIFDTSVIAKWLYGSNPKRREVIEALMACHVSVNELFKKP